MIEISASAVVSPLAEIEDSVRGTLISIGAGVRIDAFVKIKPVGGTADIRIGPNSYINSGTVIYSGNGVVIGADVLIGPNCTIAPVNHQYTRRDAPIRLQGFMPSRGGVVIDDDVWLGANSVVLDGAHIGSGCVIAAGSVVRESLEPFTVCAGAPARPIRHR